MGSREFHLTQSIRDLDARFAMPKNKPLDGNIILLAFKGETNKLHDVLQRSSAGAKGK